MYINEICAAAEAMSGIDAGALAGAAGIAEAEIISRLRPGVAAADIAGRFVAAGALLALAVHMAVSSADGVTAYSAGNMSVSLVGNGASCADTLRRQAEAVLQGCVSDDGFAFMGVNG